MIGPAHECYKHAKEYIYWDRDNQQWSMMVNDSFMNTYTEKISHCPWCGAKLEAQL